LALRTWMSLSRWRAIVVSREAFPESVTYSGW
jgi:hypothetical protein